MDRYKAFLAEEQEELATGLVFFELREPLIRGCEQSLAVRASYYAKDAARFQSAMSFFKEHFFLVINPVENG